MEFRWDDVRVFLAAWRARTFTGAARTLGVDVSTASRRLQAFEEVLGARLFDRTPDGLLPTAAAERLVAAAERAEVATLEVARVASSVERVAEGLVRVAAPPGLAEYFLAPLVTDLRRRHPGLRLAIDARTGVADLTRNEADLALRSIRPQGGDLVQQQLVDTDYVLVASRPVAKKLGVVGDLRTLPVVTWGPELAHIPAARWMATHASTEPLLVSNSIGVQLAAAAAGAGVALLPRPFVGVVRGLVEVRISDEARAKAPLPRERLWIVGHRALRDVPRVAAVWEFLVERFRGASGAV